MSNSCLLSLPDNATEAFFRYGLGSDSVEAKSYGVKYDNFEVYYAVTADTCVPMAEDVIGTFDGGMWTRLHTDYWTIRSTVSTTR